jgi:transketolase
MNESDLIRVAKKARLSTLRMTHKSKASHVGSSLSIIDIAVQLFSQIQPNTIDQEERDVVLISKGHAAAGVYSVLAHLGLIPMNYIDKFCENGSELGGHVTATHVDLLEISTGSLGHALPFGVGRALSKKKKEQCGKIYVILSDGECDEGSNWEAALLASHLKLNNLVVVIDRNRLQSLKSTEETVALEPLDKKWKSFGWQCKIINGHDFKDLSIISNDSESIYPKVYIAETNKGQGVSFMKDNILWHYKSPSDEDLVNALLELEQN